MVEECRTVWQGGAEEEEEEEEEERERRGRGRTRRLNSENPNQRFGKKKTLPGGLTDQKISYLLRKYDFVDFWTWTRTTCREN